VLESDGLEGLSALQELRIDVHALERIRAFPLPAVTGQMLFAEDLAVLGGRVYQLTYHAGLFLVYDAATLKLAQTIPYPRDSFVEGWGLAADNIEGVLFASNGTSTVHVLRPRISATSGLVERIDLVHRIEVREPNGRPVAGVNALSFAYDDADAGRRRSTPAVRARGGAQFPGTARPHLWANVYGSECLARVDASLGTSAGTIEGWVALGRGERSLWAENPDPATNVLNGIASLGRSGSDGNASSGRVKGEDDRGELLLVTGKFWPSAHRVRVGVPPQSASDVGDDGREPVPARCATTLPPSWVAAENRPWRRQPRGLDLLPLG
jgi:glutamine cyclotransferase